MTERGNEVPVFFANPFEFREWLEEHHDKTAELWVGLYKKSAGKPTITWPEAVGEALCFGWIDGVRKTVDEASYKIRFSPRRPRSVWSSVNVKRARELSRLGLMHPAGLRAFEKRIEGKTGIYSYEQRGAAKLDEAHERRFRSNKKAWDFFEAQPAWYRKAAIWWVVSAKKEETRLRRLSILVEDSEHSRTIRELTRPG
jgi:uncharacterized protein YdeI (YjbR/CyaY-like superfamily)